MSRVKLEIEFDTERNEGVCRSMDTYLSHEQMLDILKAFMFRIQQEEREVYVLTFDGYSDRYGADIYLGGVFLTEQKAEEAAKKLPDDKEFQIYKVNVDEFLGVTIDKQRLCSDCFNDFCLGGYIE